MEIKARASASFPGSVESAPPEDVVVLADGAEGALGAVHTLSVKARGVHDRGSVAVASRCAEIPLIGRDGEVSAVLCRTVSRCDPRRSVAVRGREDARTIEHVVQFVVHDINNLLAVIGSNLRLLECESHAADRKTIVGRMRQAIMRGALLSRQLLDVARPRPNSIRGFVAGGRLAVLTGTLDQALRPGITVRTDIAPGLWDFDADPEELYFALLNLCRNAADAIPDGGAITVAARNVEPSTRAARGFVEIVVADDGQGMTEEVLSQAFTPYFTTKAPGRGTGLGLAQVRRFVEARGGVVDIESKLGTGTLVRLFLPRVDTTVSSSLAATESD